MDFRRRLVATLRAIAPVLDEPGVLVVGSEVPNLIEPGAAAALYRRLGVELRHAARSNLALLSLLQASEGMPDPRPHRQRIASLLRALELEDGAAG